MDWCIESSIYGVMTVKYHFNSFLRWSKEKMMGWIVKFYSISNDEGISL